MSNSGPFDHLIRDHLALQRLATALEKAPMTQAELGEVQQAYAYLKQRLTPQAPAAAPETAPPASTPRSSPLADAESAG